MTTTPPEPEQPTSAGGPAVPPPPAYGSAGGYTTPADAGQQPPAGYAPPPAGGQPYGQQPYATPQQLSPSDERLWATLAHVGGILFGFLAPLIIWLIQKDKSAFVDDQGKEALNFQILMAIAYVVGTITSAIFIGLLIIPAAWVCTLIFGIMGGIAANKGQAYRYPFNWRLVK